MLESLTDPYLEVDTVEDLVMFSMQLQCEGLPHAQGVQPAGIWLVAVEHHMNDLMESATVDHKAKLEECSGRGRALRVCNALRPSPTHCAGSC